MFLSDIFCLIIGVSMALLRETKVLLWAKLVAKVFLLNMFCLLIIAKGNQWVFYGVAKGN